MNDDIERNLDTQARRLDELDDLIGSALDDSGAPAQLTASPHQQTYDELTAFNDELRSLRGWTDIDLDSALTDTQRAAWENWQTKHRLTWQTSDYLCVGAAGLVGFFCSWFDTSIDSAIRDRLKLLSDNSTFKVFERAGKQLPIDYTGPGFGGRNHRIKSAGHDLARPIEAIRQIMSGEFRGVRWENGVAKQVVIAGQFRSGLSATDSALFLAQHLVADVVTPMSLPIPGMSLLAEGSNEALHKFAVHAYNGLGGAGSGWNVRSGILTPSMTTIATEVLVRTYVHAEAYHRTGTPELDWPQQRRRTELLLAAHGLVSAISLGKVAAKIAAHSAAGNRLRAVHPSHIKHANIPSLLRTGTLAATVVNDAYKASKIPSTRSWDELVVATAQPWQLDLVSRFEDLGGSFDDLSALDS